MLAILSSMSNRLDHDRLETNPAITLTSACFAILEPEDHVRSP